MKARIMRLAALGGCLAVLGGPAAAAENLFKVRSDWPALEAGAWFPADPATATEAASPYIPVDPARAYRLGGWFFGRTQDARLSFGLALYDAGRKPVPAEDRNLLWIVDDIPVNPVNWAEYTRVIAPAGGAGIAFPAGTAFVRVVLRVGAGRVYFGTEFVTVTVEAP